MAIVQISQITQRKGLQTDLPDPLAGGELGWSVDERRLFIGNGTLQEGAPVVGNTELLTEYSNILPLIANANVVVASLSTTGNVTANILTGNSVLANTVSTAGTVTVGTDATITGNLTVLGNTTISGLSTNKIQNGNSRIIISATAANATVDINGTSNVAVFSNIGLEVAGFTSVSGNVIGGNILTSSVVSASGNVRGGNINTAGQVVATGNVTGGNITTAGLVSVTANIIGGNINTAGQVVATGNVTGGNILTAGVVSTAGNVIASNLVLSIQSKIFGDFTSSAANGRTVFQTLSTTTSGYTGITAIPGDNNISANSSGFSAYVSSDVGNSSWVLLQQSNTESRIISGKNGISSFLPFSIYTSNINRFIVDLNGNIGLGNTNPLDTLAVTGNTYISGNITVGNYVTQQGLSTSVSTGVSNVITISNITPAAQITYSIVSNTGNVGFGTVRVVGVTGAGTVANVVDTRTENGILDITLGVTQASNADPIVITANNISSNSATMSYSISYFS